MLRNLFLALGISLFSFASAAETLVLEDSGPAAPGSYVETPSLEAAVAAGSLPAVGERLPAAPLVVPETDYRSGGEPGGEITMLVGRAKDSRLLSVYGYARLVGYDDDFNIVPDLLEKIEIEDNKVFTLHLRPGHRWSDGEPFTTEDFRYWWEDVANNPELSLGGPPVQLLVDGQPPVVEVLDETTVRYSWPAPNPFFLPALAGATPLYIYTPAHYLKDFHQAYADPAALQERIAGSGKDNWASLHNQLDNLYRMDNPALPTLEPWQVQTEQPTERIIAERNPYYHRVDQAGHQLPYLDRFILSVVSPGLIPTKTGAGESDLQSRGINFSDYTFLKDAQQRTGFQVFLWQTVRGSELALYPNLNVNDEGWRSLLRDARFRRALSLAVNRSEINQVIYYGLGLEGAHTVLPGSPLYRPEYRDAWAGYDIKQANALLDEMGLTERNGAGTRLMPDGRPLEIVIESAGENTEEADVLELIGSSWKQIGVKVFSKPSERTVLRNRIFAGDTVMAIWFGYENGLPTPNWSPEEFVPVRQQSYHWPKWGQFYETKGSAGEAPDMAVGEELLSLYDAWRKAESQAEQREVWQRILEIHAEEVFTIGIVAGIPQPIVANAKLRNIPAKAIYNWEPGAQFGVYQPSSFWLEK